jgi:hypothetical protein
MSNPHGIAPSPHASPRLDGAAASGSPPVLVGDSQAELQRMQQQMAQLYAELQSQRAQLQQAQQQAQHAAAASAATGSAQPAPSVPRPPELPKIPAPAAFKGETGFVVDTFIRDLTRVFDFHRLASDSSRIAYAVSFLAGPASTWWDSLGAAERARLETWASFVECLRARFRPVQAAMLARQRLDQLRQKASQSVNAYSHAFQMTLTPITDMSDADQVHHFINGLLAPIAGKVLEKQPATLKDAIDAAVSIEAMRNFGRAGATFNVPSYTSRSGGHGASSSSSGVPMDVNNVNAEPDLSGAESEAIAPADPNGALMAMLQSMEQRINALAQQRSSAPRAPASSSSKGKSGRVPGLSAEEARQLLRERRCLACKKPGHFKRECPDFL